MGYIYAVIIVALLVIAALFIYSRSTGKKSFWQKGGNKVIMNGQEYQLMYLSRLKQFVQSRYTNYDTQLIDREVNGLLHGFATNMDVSLNNVDQARYLDACISDYVKRHTKQ